MMHALVRNGKMARLCPSQGHAEAERLLDSDRVLPVEEVPFQDDEVPIPLAEPVYTIEADRVIRDVPRRKLSPEEMDERIRQRRAASYPPIGDQLDAIWKALSALEGATLPAEASAILTEIRKVKADHPKR